MVHQYYEITFPVGGEDGRCLMFRITRVFDSHFFTF
jgi:hypothetical protein